MPKKPHPKAKFEIGQQVLVADTPKHWREVTITSRKYVDSREYPGWIYGHNHGGTQNGESCYSLL